MKKSMPRTISFLAVITLALPQVALGQSSNTWEQTSGPTGGASRGIVTAGNQLFATQLYSGVYASSDGGLTWSLRNHGMEGLSTSILTQSRGVLFAGVFQTGFYRSTNSGANWTPVNSGLAGSQFTSLYATESTIFAGLMFGGLYRSTNNGDLWVRANTGLYSSTENINGFGARSNAVFALGLRRMYRSTNEGVNWVQVGTELTRTSFGSFATVGSDIFVGTADGIVVSHDGGDHWSQPNTALDGMWVRGLCAAGSALFAGTDSHGVYRSTDNGVTWAPATNGLINRRISNLFSQDSVLLAGTDGNGIFRSENQGDSWTESNTGLIGTMVQDLLSFDGRLLAGTWGAGLFSMTTDGVWSHLPSGPLAPGLEDVQSLVVSGNQLLAGSTIGLYASTNSGQAWEPLGAGPNSSSSYVMDIALLGSAIYLAADDGFWCSTNAGLTWTNASTGLPAAMIYSVEASTNVILAVMPWDGVYRTTNQGVNWTPAMEGIGAGETCGPITAYGGKWFLGTSGGLYRSLDDGLHWTPAAFAGQNVGLMTVNQGLLFLTVGPQATYYTQDGTNWIQMAAVWPESVNQSSMAVHDGYLYIGTDGSGVWRTSLAGILPGHSVQFSQPAWLTDGTFQAQILGTNIGTIVIESTTNLSDWVPVLTNAPFVSPFEFRDTNTGMFPQRFYRIQGQP